MSDEPPASTGIGPGPDPESWPWGAAVQPPVDLPLDFEAYVLANRDPFLDFAAEMLGDQAAADGIVHEVLTYLAIHWADVLRRPDVEDATWSVLAQAVVAEVRRTRREQQLAERIARASDILARMRAGLADLETAIGLYPALAELTPRQFDVVVLKGPMRRSTFFTAWILDMHPSTVDRTYNRALARLEQALGPRRVLNPGPRPRRKGARR
jgi:DNA-directed RNA polymerase specialized sigma24 family protein